MRGLVLVVSMMWVAACEEPPADIEPYTPESGEIAPLLDEQPPGAYEEVELEALDTAADDLLLGEDGFNACFAAPGAPGPNCYRTRTRCSYNAAFSAALAAARAGCDDYCDNQSYGPLASTQCDGPNWYESSPPVQCAYEDDHEVDSYTRSEENECGVWPFRWRSHIVRVKSENTCGWLCET